MKRPEKFPSLSEEDRQIVTTACAAHHLNRSAQTLRKWACFEKGPIRPIRINGQLAWRTADIRRLVGEEVVCA